MNEISPNGAIGCAFICAGGCLVCISDGPVIVVDFVSGGTALTTGTAASPV